MNRVVPGLVFLAVACKTDAATAVRTTPAPVTLERAPTSMTVPDAEGALIERIVAYLPAENRQLVREQLRTGFVRLTVSDNPGAQALVDSLYTLRRERRANAVLPGPASAFAEVIVALVPSVPEPGARAVVMRRLSPPQDVILVTGSTSNADIRNAIAMLSFAHARGQPQSSGERLPVYASTRSDAVSSSVPDIIDWRQLRTSALYEVPGVGQARTVSIRLKLRP